MSYVHIPFLEMEHENLGASMNDLEAVMNLGYGELHPTDLPEGVELEDRRMCHNWGDSHPHLYELLRADLVRKLHTGHHRDAHTKALSAKCGAAEVCVAVHIRCGLFVHCMPDVWRPMQDALCCSFPGKSPAAYNHWWSLLTLLACT